MGSAPPHILSLLLPVLMPGTEETKQTRSCPQEFSIHPGKIKQVHKEPENSWWQVAGAQRQGETKFVYQEGGCSGHRSSLKSFW